MDPTGWHQRALPQTVASPPANNKKKPTKRSWEENYAALLVYKSEHGDLLVPHKYAKCRVLSKWVSHLRENYNNGQLSQDRIEALEAIGFVWNPHEKKWNESYQRLVQFWKKNGHTKVPICYKEDPALGKWVSRQREDYSGNYISETRKKKLDALGFVWRISKNGTRQKRKRPTDDRWQQRYNQLLEFHKEHGHANVPRPDSSRDPLAGWVGVQRCNFSRGLMPPERIKLLKDIGFVFNFREQQKQQDWNRMYELLKVCQRKEGGGFQVSIVGDEASSVSRWIQRQKEKYKMYKLEPGREILLRKLDFQFPERPPRPENDDDKKLKTALKLVDNARANAFGAGEGEAEKSMVGVLVDLAGEDKDMGKKVAESIGVLSKFMSISAEELATRISAPIDRRTNNNEQAPVQAIEVNAFAALMPLIVTLRETVNDSAMQDCVDFLASMVQRSKAEGSELFRCDASDPYNKLLSLAVELGQQLDQSERSRALVKNVQIYFEHIMTEAGRAIGDDSSSREPSSKKQRTEGLDSLKQAAKHCFKH